MALRLPGRFSSIMTSSTKPEVHCVLSCCLRTTELRSQLKRTENFAKFGRVVLEIRERTDIHADRHTDKLIAMDRTPSGGEVKIGEQQVFLSRLLCIESAPQNNAGNAHHRKKNRIMAMRMNEFSYPNPNLWP